MIILTYSKFKRMRFLFSCLVITTLLSCGGVFKNVSSNYDHSINFSSYKTYAWLDKSHTNTETPFNNEIVANNIKNHVDNELENRGYTFNSDAPDLLIELVLNDKDKVSTTSVPIYSAPEYFRYPINSYRYYNPKTYRWNQHGYRNYTYLRPPYQIGDRIIKTPYNQSTITINVFDRKKNSLIWMGSAKGDVYDDNYMQKDIPPAIEKILKAYPIKAILKK